VTAVSRMSPSRSKTGSSTSWRMQDIYRRIEEVICEAGLEAEQAPASSS
jgi:hypothetical protein